MDNIKVGQFGKAVTPEQVLLDLLNRKNIKTIVVSWMDDDDFIYTVHSHGMSLTKLGMLEVSKQFFLQATQDAGEEAMDDDST